MNKKSRLFRILGMINLLGSRHKRWKVRELAEHFEVTPKTIYRDFELMEDMRIPIYQDEKNHSYSILDNFYFKPPDMTKKEALALLLVSQVFQEEFFPYKEDLNTAIAKIINSLPFSIRQVVTDIGKQISYQYGAFVDLSNYKEIIQIIEKSIENYTSLIISYFSLSSNKTSERKVDPYQIIYKNGACYLIAHCHERKSILFFRVDRINNIRLTKEIYSIPEDFSIKKYMKNTWGVERSDKEKRVVLIFSSKAAILVKEMEWHETQEIINLPGNKIRFEITTGSMEEIKNWILSYGSSVEVIRPRGLKEEVIAEIEKMQENYR